MKSNPLPKRLFLDLGLSDEKSFLAFCPVGLPYNLSSRSPSTVSCRAPLYYVQQSSFVLCPAVLQGSLVLRPTVPQSSLILCPAGQQSSHVLCPAGRHASLSCRTACLTVLRSCIIGLSPGLIASYAPPCTSWPSDQLHPWKTMSGRRTLGHSRWKF